MTKKKLRKALALGVVVALGLSLTACYVPPDDVTDDPNSVAVNNNTAWKGYDVATAIPTQAPTPTPTIAPAVTDAASTDNNWGWGSAETATPNPQGAQQTIGVATNPVIGLTTSTAKPATQPLPIITPVPQTAAPGTSSTSGTGASPTGSLKVGSSGSDVRTVQRLLKNLGYYSGSVDGDFGAATQNAVIAFQRANGLEEDGKVGYATLAKLNSSSAVSYAQSRATAAPRVT